MLFGSFALFAGGLFWASRRANASTSPGPLDGGLVRLEEFGEDALNTLTLGPWQLPARAAPYAAAIYAAEDRYGIPRNLLARQLYQESHFRADIITGATVSPAGALGIAQFMPATAAELGVDPLDPASAIDGAGRYMAKLFQQLGDWSLALAAYNWGIGNVQRRGLAQAPQETRDYVAGILGDIGYA